LCANASEIGNDAFAVQYQLIFSIWGIIFVFDSFDFLYEDFGNFATILSMRCNYLKTILQLRESFFVWKNNFTMRWILSLKRIPQK
jgi:hypothetical protein